MGKPHKHVELIKAWADGTKVEFYDDGRKVWTYVANPGWNPKIKYRIKEEPKYIPFETLEECQPLIGRLICTHHAICMITGAFMSVDIKDNPILYFYTGDSKEPIDAAQFLKHYKFKDRDEAPCGKLEK